MNRLLPLSLAVALALGSTTAQALGLGGINVKSELNQPLRAEIPVYVSAPAEAESLRVELAAAAEFARVGLDIGNIGVPLEFDVGKNARGEPVIVVTSNQAIREPTLTFLVEVNWSNGRFLREYAVLLEPPVSVPVTMPSAPPSAVVPAASVQPIAEPEAVSPTPISAPEPLPEPEVAEAPVPEPPPLEAPAAATPPEAEPAAVEPEPEVAPSEPLASEPPAPEPEAAPVSMAPSASEYGPIASGETLWEIANTTRPGNITPNQMMIALLRANPDAFFRDNVNALKRGAILRIPGESDLQALAAAEAAAEIVSQNQAWIEATRPTTVADASVASSATASAPVAASTRPNDRLELVPPASGQSTSDRPGAPGGTGDSAAVRAELARTKESLSSVQLESGELRSRVKELETINSTNQRLLTLKDSELKGLQDKLKAAEVAAAAQAAQKPVVTTPPPPMPEPDPVMTPDALTSEPIAAADPLAATADTPVSDPAAAPDETADPLAAADAPADSEASTDSTDSAEVTPIADAEPVAVGTPAAPAAEPWYGALMNKYVLGGLGLLVLGGLGFAMARRRKPELPAVAPGSISGQFGDSVGGDNEESSMLSALAQDPTDLNAHLNVLEFYYMRRNADKFEAAAEAMYAQLPDPNAPEWQGALLMGRDLCPTHPMFSDGSEMPEAGGNAFADPFASVPRFDGHEPAAKPVADGDDFDFDLGVTPPAATP
ncbi:MAG TPA: FimV/HubP family polar landmark protein, partial [Patescibacteria group bacterium]|nr:FimV/HubP family polar landmark protein [Patescibacteria group bacterium]